MMRTSLRLSALLIVGTFALAGPASAATEGPQLSRDGASWSQDLGAPLFGATDRWVPGDEQVRSFLVRNSSAADAGRLTVELLGTGVDDLIRTGDVTIAMRAGSGSWIQTHASGCQRLITGVAMDPHGVERVDMLVRLDPTTTNQAQLNSLDLDLRILMSQDLGPLDIQPVDCEPSSGGSGPSTPAVPATPPSTTPTSSPQNIPTLSAPPMTRISVPTGILPNTGAPTFWAALAGTISIVAGLIAVLGRRKEEDSRGY